MTPMFAESVAEFGRQLGCAPAAVDDAERIDRIRALEELKSAVAAAQLAETAAFDASQRAAQAAGGVRAERQGRGVAAQVALARRISPHRAVQQLGWAKILTSELPRTFAALQAGRISEWRAIIIARETIWLSREHRARVDAALAPRLERLGDRQLEGEARRLAQLLDPAGAVARLGHAESERRVGIRPAPDVMAYLTALLPAAQAVACYKALSQHADTLIGAGDGRSRGQIMADTLVARLTGQETAADLPVEINLIMTDQALFGPDVVAADGSDASHADPANPADRAGGGDLDSDLDGDLDPDLDDDADVDDDTDVDDDADPDPDATAAGGAGSASGDEPAYLLGYGYLPAPYVRWLIRDASAGTPMWLRRLYRHPDTGQLAAMDSRRRCFSRSQRHFVQLRDQTCRTPWCGAPIRHVDHIRAAEHGGPTSVDNAEGLCAACNYAKAAPGWHARVTNGGTVTLTTPTGHQYQHRPPDPPGAGPPGTHRRSPESERARIADRLDRLVRLGRLHAAA